MNIALPDQEWKLLNLAKCDYVNTTDLTHARIQRDFPHLDSSYVICHMTYMEVILNVLIISRNGAYGNERM